jgi:hypothetical protein
MSKKQVIQKLVNLKGEENGKNINIKTSQEHISFGKD